MLAIDYIHFNESRLHELDVSGSSRSFDQLVGEYYKNILQNIINNEELHKAVNFVYTAMQADLRAIFQNSGCVVVWSMVLHKETLHESQDSV